MRKGILIAVAFNTWKVVLIQLLLQRQEIYCNAEGLYYRAY
jgi:hypothetical protein